LDHHGSDATTSAVRVCKWFCKLTCKLDAELLRSGGGGALDGVHAVDNRVLAREVARGREDERDIARTRGIERHAAE